MTRIKRGFVAKKRRKKIISLTKGFVGSHSKLFTAANQQMMKALRYSYSDRKKKKSDMKKLWIKRINASTRKYQIKYSKFIAKLKESKINIDRKILSQISLFDNSTFKLIVEKTI